MQRRTLLKALAAGGMLPLAAGAAAPTASGSWRDVLDTPAQRSPLAPNAILTGLTRAGQRIVAVGQRGHVLLSDDAGKSWQQADVPVSADLVAVSFPTAESGWAVGHDGVVLHSTDAGRTWTRPARRPHPRQRPRRPLHQERRRQVARRSERFAAQGAENPFLDVWFDDARSGIVVGAFGLALRTSDGGQPGRRSCMPPTTRRPPPLRGAARRRRALHRRRAGPAAEARPRRRALLGADPSLRGNAVRAGRQGPRRTPTACAATSSAAPTAARAGKASRPASASA